MSNVHHVDFSKQKNKHETNAYRPSEKNPDYDAYIDDIIEMTTGLDSDEFDALFPECRRR